MTAQSVISGFIFGMLFQYNGKTADKIKNGISISNFK
jgi:hypothetical protein